MTRQSIAYRYLLALQYPLKVMQDKAEVKVIKDIGARMREAWTVSEKVAIGRAIEDELIKLRKGNKQY